MRTTTIAVFAAIVPLLVSAAWMAGGKTIDASHWNASGKTLDASLYVSANGGRYTADNAYASQTWAFAVGPAHSNAPAIEINGANLEASANVSEHPGSVVIKAGDNQGNGNPGLDDAQGAVLLQGGANAGQNSYGGPILFKLGAGTLGSGLLTVKGADNTVIMQIAPHPGGGHDLYLNVGAIYGGESPMIDVQNRTLHSSNGTMVIDLDAGQGINQDGQIAVSWGYERKLYDASQEACLDWTDRNLIGDQGLGLSVATWTGSAFTVHTRLAIKRPDGTTLTLTPTNEPTAGAALRWSGTGCYWGP